MARSLGLFIALLVWSASASASALSYHIRTYGEADGLSNQAVFGIDQTPDGRVWLATRKSLVVYDGASWTEVIQGFDRVGSGLREVVVDERGGIWIANILTPAQISWFDGSVWNHLPPPPVELWGWDVVHFDVAIDQDGSRWVAMATSDRLLVVWDGERWKIHDLASRFGSVYAIQHGDGRFLLASDGGLWQLPMEVGAEPTLIPGRETRPCYGLAFIPDDGLWIVENGGVVHRNPDGNETAHDIAALQMDQLKVSVSTTVDRKGGLYLGTPSQVVHFHPDRGHEILDRDSGLASEGATDLFTDREGNVWVCSPRGLSKIVSRELGTLDRRHGLMDDEVTAILRLRDGRMLLGHEHGMTILEDVPRPVRFDVTPGLRSRIMDLQEAEDGSVWAAMDRHGLARIAPNGEVTWLSLLDPLNGAAFSVLLDENGTLWVGGNAGDVALTRLTEHGLEPVPLPLPKLGQAPFARRLARASGGGIYIMTGRHGVFHLQQGVFTSWSKAVTPGALSTYCKLDRPDGTVWIGTSAGVHRLGDGILEPVAELESVVGRPIFAMLTDGMGRVWMGTDEGLRIWNGRELQSVRVGDGLAGSEVNRDGLWLDDDGSMWVGTDRGVTRFEAGYLAEPRALPLVEFVGFEIDGVSVPADQPQERRGRISLLVARFRGVSLVDENRIRYRTWLEGFEDDWQPLAPAPLRQLRYTNLAPGSYRFHVQAVGIHGEESSVAVSAPVVVVPPIWRTWWFLTGLALSAAAMIGAVTALVLGRRNERRLKRMVRERTSRLNEMEQAARAESERMSATLQSISDGVLAVDGRGKLVLANRAAAAMLGKTPDALLGCELGDYLPPLSSVESTTSAPIVVRQELREGREIALEATVAPLGLDSTASAGRVIALRDVTDRSRFEEEMARAQRLESLGVLAGGIAHDFNNLLTVILAHTSLLEETGLRNADRETVSRIRLSSEKAQKLTQQLLTFARGGEPRREPTALGPLIEDTVAFAMSGATARCRYEIEDSLWPAMIDPDQVNQALSNLLINACQAMPNGGEITIEGRNLRKAPDWLRPGNYVELSVSDQGAGLPIEDRERIFEPFFTTKPDGNGLGLAVAYSVARRHGGGLTAGASPSGGATFTIVLPAASGHQSQQTQQTDIARAVTERVLVMDDDSAVCEAIVMMLDSLGCEAVGVADGAEALMAWREAQDSGRPFNLAILDLTVPGAMGGRETIRELHELQPGLQAIVASGYSNDEVLADPESFGFAGAIVKPFDTKSLAEAMRAVLPGAKSSGVRKSP